MNHCAVPKQTPAPAPAMAAMSSTSRRPEHRTRMHGGSHQSRGPSGQFRHDKPSAFLGLVVSREPVIGTVRKVQVVRVDIPLPLIDACEHDDTSANELEPIAEQRGQEERTDDVDRQRRLDPVHGHHALWKGCARVVYEHVETRPFGENLGGGASDRSKVPGVARHDEHLGVGLFRENELPDTFAFRGSATEEQYRGAEACQTERHFLADA